MTLSALERAGNNSYAAPAFTEDPMFTHAQIWSAIDLLAARAGFSASGLAKRAGLDPTTFNKSKRVTAAGRPRWPSTESINKALVATNTSLGWDEIAFPAVADEHAYALEVSGQSMEPAYRDGDVILISPAAPKRRGDRVVVKTKAGEVMVKELKRETAKSIELKSLSAAHPDRTIAMSDVLWIARILWASQ
jgi:phage repressor protein C with HTH and peptisase S24 domain